MLSVLWGHFAFSESAFMGQMGEYVCKTNKFIFVFT